MIIVLDDEVEFITPVHADKRLKKYLSLSVEICEDIVNIIYFYRDLDVLEIFGILVEQNFESIKMTENQIERRERAGL